MYYFRVLFYKRMHRAYFRYSGPFQETNNMFVLTECNIVQFEFIYIHIYIYIYIIYIYIYI